MWTKQDEENFKKLFEQDTPVPPAQPAQPPAVIYLPMKKYEEEHDVRSE
jgi:hypothetical protein